MRVLRIHNRYQQRGGEDVSFESETQLLRDAGHTVETLEFTNDDIPATQPLAGQLRLAATTVWSRTARARVAATICRFRPEVAHFDNTFPLVSPAAYSACNTAGVAVVQTLHNYRLLCPSATFYRDGHPCEDCLGRTPPLPGIVHGCYRDSRSQSAVVAAMLTTHRLLRTWARDVDCFIALTEFAKEKFIEGGLPGARITVKPNFVADIPQLVRGRERGLLFVGRMSPEKGISTLLQATRLLPSSIAIRIAGDGPLVGMLESALPGLPGLDVLGHLDRDRVIMEMQNASALIFPSEWYEGYPLTIVEAFACCTPVIASRLGAMAEIVEDDATGLLFEPGNAEDLAAKIRWAVDNPQEMRRMGANARRAYEARYTPERNHLNLKTIYNAAISRRQHEGDTWP